MHTEDYILDALEMVSAWDIPDEDFAQAVNDQAKLMACMNPDEINSDVLLTDTSIHSLPATLPSSSRTTPTSMHLRKSRGRRSSGDRAFWGSHGGDFSTGDRK